MYIIYFSLCIFYWSNRDIKEKWSHNMVSHLKKSAPPNQKQVWCLSMGRLSHLLAQVSPQQEKGYSKKTCGLLPRMKGIVQPRCLVHLSILWFSKLAPRPGTLISEYLLETQFLKSHPRHTDTKCLGRG